MGVEIDMRPVRPNQIQLDGESGIPANEHRFDGDITFHSGPVAPRIQSTWHADLTMTLSSGPTEHKRTQNKTRPAQLHSWAGPEKPGHTSRTCARACAIVHTPNGMRAPGVTVAFINSGQHAFKLRVRQVVNTNCVQHSSASIVAH